MFRLNRNERSHWSGNGVHVESELVFMIGRNMQEKSIQEKDKMIRQLQLRVAELESHLEGLKQEYKSLQSNLHRDQHRMELLEIFKRVPR
ncbi:hypothetical protein [Aeromonas caviae]|uniref:hypothetical protein n=1 Tax=Aeromonas caviae TaxID=648 RepID=UPI0024426AC0|nr:hypothetical protein [Aeromonas caviae]